MQPETATSQPQQASIKISTVFTLAGHAEVTMKHRAGETEQLEVVIIKSCPPKYDLYELE